MAITKQVTMTEFNGTDYDTLLPKSAYATTGTLTAAGWSSNQQTINVPQVSADSVVIIAPHPTYTVAYSDAGIVCNGQSEGKLTFSRQKTTSVDIPVNIIIL